MSENTQIPVDIPVCKIDPVCEVDALIEKCDGLIDQPAVDASRHKFMESAIESYQQASVLLGYFSQLKDFDEELEKLNNKLTKHRTKILSSYIDILPQDYIKSLSVPSKQTKLFQKGIHKYHKVKNYILYDYRRKLYNELEYEDVRIDKIKMLVDTIVRLDKHYDIYEELIVDMQKKNKKFNNIMCKHMTEYIYI